METLIAIVVIGAIAAGHLLVLFCLLCLGLRVGEVLFQPNGKK